MNTHCSSREWLPTSMSHGSAFNLSQMFAILGVGLALWWSYTESNIATSALGTSLGGVPREQKILKGHPPRVIYYQVY